MATMDALEPRQLLSSAPVITGFANANPDVTVYARQQVELDASFADQDGGDFHASKINWGDGFWSYASSAAFSDGAGTIAGSHHFLAPGVYHATLTLDDGQGNQVTSDPVQIDVASSAPASNTGNAHSPTLSVNQQSNSLSMDEGTINFSNNDLDDVEGLATANEYATYTFTCSPTTSQTDTIEGWVVGWDDCFSGDLNYGSAYGSTVDLSHLFMPAGSYDVWIEAEGQNGQYSTDCYLTVSPSSVVLTGFPTQVSVNGTSDTESPLSVYPGDTVQLGCSFTGPDWGYYGQGYGWSTIDWGDGTGGQQVDYNTLNFSSTPSGGSGTMAGEHQYSQPGTYYAQLALTDGYTDTVYSDSEIVVNPYNPTLNISGQEDDSGRADPMVGRNYTLTLGATGLGSDTIQAWHVDWAWNEGEDYTDTVASGSTATMQNQFQHSGEYTLNIEADLQDGEYFNTQYTVDVQPVSIVPDTPGVQDTSGGTQVYTGDTVQLTANFAGPDLAGGGQEYYNSTIDWGDGSVVAVDNVTFSSGAGTIEAQHQYAEIGTYNAQLIISDGQDAPVDADLVQVNVVHDGAPDNLSLTLTNDAILEGGATGISGTFTDNDSLEAHTVSIDWGDSTTPDTVNLSVGVYSFTSSSHTYSTEGDYGVIVSVADGEQDSTADEASVAVYTRQPIIQATGPGTINEGVTADINFSAAFEPMAPGVVTWVIDWDDGNSDRLSGSATQDSHLYATGNGTYAVTVRAITSENGQLYPYDAPSPVYVSVIPNAPTGLTADGTGLARWSAGSGLDVRYRVEESSDGQNFTYLDTIDGTSYNAQPGCAVRVWAVNGNGDRSAFDTAQSPLQQASGVFTYTTNPSSGPVQEDGGALGGLTSGGLFARSQVGVDGWGNVNINIPGYGSVSFITLDYNRIIERSVLRGLNSFSLGDITFTVTVTYGSQTGGGWGAHSVWSGSWTQAADPNGKLSETVTLTGSSTMTISHASGSDAAPDDFNIVVSGESDEELTGTWICSGPWAPFGDSEGGPPDTINYQAVGSYVAQEATHGQWTGTSDYYSHQYEDPNADENSTGTIDYSYDLKYTDTWRDVTDASKTVVGLTAYRTWGQRDAVSQGDQESQDPSNYVILTNNDYEQDPQGLLNDMDYNAQVLEQQGHIGTAALADNDLAAITLHQAPQAKDFYGDTVSGGTVTITLSGSGTSVRLYDGDGNVLWDPSIGDDTKLTASLSGSSYLAGLANGDVTIYVEGLTVAPDFSLTYSFTAPTGSITPPGSTSIHMAIADVGIVDIQGDPVSAVPDGILPDDLVRSATSGDASSVYDANGAIEAYEFAPRVEGVRASEIQSLTLVSDAGGIYTANPTDAQFADGLSGVQDRVFTILANSDGYGSLTSDQQQQIMSFYNVNTLANGGVVETIQTLKDKHERRICTGQQDVTEVDFGTSDGLDLPDFTAPGPQWGYTADDPSAFESSPGASAPSSLASSGASSGGLRGQGSATPNTPDANLAINAAAAESTPLTTDAIVLYYRAAFGAAGEKLLNAFIETGNHLEIHTYWRHWPNPSRSDKSDLSGGFWSTSNKSTIQIADDLNPSAAAIELHDRLVQASGYGLNGMRGWLMDKYRLTSDSDWQQFKDSQLAGWQAGVGVAATLAKAYYEGLTLATGTGGNLVLTINDVSEGNFLSLARFVPLVGAALSKTGGRVAVKISESAAGKISESLLERMEAEAPMLHRYIAESGGRWGGTATRTLNYELAGQLKREGYEIISGVGKAEEWIPGPGGGTLGGTFVDITAKKGSHTIRIQTVTTLADGVTLTEWEEAAAARIRAAFPNDELRLVPKRTAK
jgi:hypothetical protein